MRRLGPRNLIGIVSLMTVHQLRINAVTLLTCALEVIEFGQLAAAATPKR